MTQNFYGQVDQVAGEKIINIYVNLKNNNVDISEISQTQILQTVNYVKKLNKKIYQKRYINFPCLAILLIFSAIISVSVLNLHALVSTNTSTFEPLFSGNTLFIIVVVSLFLIPIFSKSLYERTKYLHPILIENNKIIYELELEIQRRELWGE